MYVTTFEDLAVATILQLLLIGHWAAQTFGTFPEFPYRTQDAESHVIVNDDFATTKDESLSANVNRGEWIVDVAEDFGEGVASDGISLVRQLLPFVKECKWLQRVAWTIE
jgi:hypothetical protein